MGVSGVEVVDQRAVDVAGDVAFKATQDLLFRQAFLGASLDVGPGAWVPAHGGQSEPSEV